MFAQTLPEELLELIFGFMHDDKESLSHCSRVCHAWLPPSSRLLFHKLHEHWYPLESPDAIKSDWCADFLKELKTRERAQSCVQHLVLSSERFDCLPVCRASSLREILQTLPNLKSFAFPYLEFVHDTSASSSLSDGLGNKLSLDTVTLSYVLTLTTRHGQVAESDASESTGLAEFLGLFERIGALHIANGALPWTYPFTYHLLNAKLVPLPRLTPLWVEELHLAEFQGAKMLGVLKETVDPRGLHMLAVELRPEMLVPADAFLKRMTELRRVRFTMSIDLPHRGPVALPSLLACSKLQSLQIHLLPFRLSTRGAPLNMLILSAAVGVLSAAPPSVTQITLDLRMIRHDGSMTIRGERVLRQLDWTAFEEALGRLPVLEAVVLRGVTELGPVLWTEETKDAMCQCVTHRTQRVLQFV